MRPNFLVIGAQKCATSSLCHHLGRHPDVFMCEPKEPYFFSEPDVWAKGFAWYESLFEDAADTRAVGEGSTTYSMHGLYPWVVDRIVEHLPDVRLIYIVRDPLERIQSHWMHLRSRQNREIRDFNDAVFARPEYIDNSLYYRQLEVYRPHVPRERMLVLFFDDFRHDQPGTLRRTFSFLDVDPDIPLEVELAPRHESAKGRVDRGVTPWLRRLPFFDRLSEASPTPLRDTVRRLLKQPIGERPEWSDAVRQQVIEVLYLDSRAMLETYGKPLTLWPWVADAAATRRAVNPAAPP